MKKFIRAKRQGVSVGTRAYKKYGKFSIDRVMSICEETKITTENGYKYGKSRFPKSKRKKKIGTINFNNHYFKSILRYGTRCWECGLEGDFFMVENHIDNGHGNKNNLFFALYGTNEDGDYVEITTQLENHGHVHPLCTYQQAYLQQQVPCSGYRRVDEGKHYPKAKHVQAISVSSL